MSNKDLYRKFCETADVPLFSRDWWLDAVCGDDWDVSLALKDGRVAGSLPYHARRKWGFTLLVLPPLTKSLGPWITYPAGQKYETRLSYEKEIMWDLIAGLPRFDMFHQNFSPEAADWLPFHWKGFSQTTSYTYVIEDLSDPDAIFAEFRDKIRTSIRKAGATVAVSGDGSVEEFFKVSAKTFERQGLGSPYTLDRLKSLDRALAARNSRRIFTAKDASGTVHSALYLVWDGRTAYYLMGGGDPALRTSAAASLLLWDAIRFSSGVAKVFDFEGSMMESVERFFRAFGARRKPYSCVSKVPSKVLRTKMFLKDLFRRR